MIVYTPPAMITGPADGSQPSHECDDRTDRSREGATLALMVAKLERVSFMIALIVAGEAVFSLPFHVARFFRPTVL